MHIIHIASELAPIAKVGGLGDVVAGLTKELKSNKKVTKISIYLPYYGSIKAKTKLFDTFKSYEDKKWLQNELYHTKVNNVDVYLIKDKRRYFYPKKIIYGDKKDLLRFMYFCRSAMDYISSKNKKVDVLHLHDWHTSFCSVLYKEVFQNLDLSISKIVLTIHNLKYQGTGRSSYLKRFGIFDKIPHIKGKTKFSINLLKAGIIYSDAITTVSPTYAKEILTKKYGCGLNNILIKNKSKLFGILNGIDTDVWSPKKDPFLNNLNYSKNDSIKKVLEKKKKNRKKLNLIDISSPLIISITRLVPQKGPKLIKTSIIETIENDAAFALLGTGDKKTNLEFKNLLTTYKETKRLSISLDFCNKLSHLLFAAADFIIIPSAFEPCGLTQMIALNYGCIPIVRKTGGLSDTVIDIKNKNGNGIVFKNFSKKDAKLATTRAINLHQNNFSKFKLLMKKGLSSDFSWKRSAAKYLKIYLS
jgi:starch synthase